VDLFSVNNNGASVIKFTRENFLFSFIIMSNELAAPLLILGVVALASVTVANKRKWGSLVVWLLNGLSVDDSGEYVPNDGNWCDVFLRNILEALIDHAISLDERYHRNYVGEGDDGLDSRLKVRQHSYVLPSIKAFCRLSGVCRMLRAVCRHRLLPRLRGRTFIAAHLHWNQLETPSESFLGVLRRTYAAEFYIQVTTSGGEPFPFHEGWLAECAHLVLATNVEGHMPPLAWFTRPVCDPKCFERVDLGEVAVVPDFRFQPAPIDPCIVDLMELLGGGELPPEVLLLHRRLKEMRAAIQQGKVFF
jgi:hypothetical protein